MRTHPRVLGTAGFSLVEMMVALAIGLTITVAVVQIFASTRSAYQLDEGLARLQENGRFAMDFLTREIRMASDNGCREVGQISPNAVYDNTIPGFATPFALQGFEANGTAPGDIFNSPAIDPGNTTAGWTPALNVGLVPGSGGVAGAIPGTDVIVVRRMANVLTTRAPHVDATTVFLALADANKIGVGDTAVIANCRQASVFRVSGTANGGADLQHAADPCAVWSRSPPNPWPAASAPCREVDQDFTDPRRGLPQIGILQTTVFYLARGASGMPALHSLTLGPAGAAAPVELVEGIENMQILYGVDVDASTRGDPDAYVTADNVADWSRVVSVHVSVLVRTQGTAGPAVDTTRDTNTYILAGPEAGSGVTINPVDDFRRRRIFGATIQLRNKGA